MSGIARRLSRVRAHRLAVALATRRVTRTVARTHRPRAFHWLAGQLLPGTAVPLLLTAALLAAGALPARTAAQEPGGLELASAVEQVLVDVIARCEPSVVSIARVRSDRFIDTANPLNPDFVPNEFATGVVVDSRGLILTNHHLLDEQSQYWVTTIGGQVYRVMRVKGADPRSDLAVLEVDADDLVPMPLGDGGNVRKGQIVVALGNPYAIARDGEASASWGIVANVARKLPPDVTGGDHPVRWQLQHFGTLIQTDARLNLGTSGGALINLKGEMIGLTTSMAAIAGYEQSAGYAVPVDETFRRIVETLKEGREVEYGLLGVELRNLSLDELAGGLTGAQVVEVFPGTPAFQAGLARGDIVVQVGESTIRTADDLMYQVGRLPAEALVQLRVVRDPHGRRTTLEPLVRLAKLQLRVPPIVTRKEPAWRGLRVDYITARWSNRDRFASALSVGGVVVTEVEPESPAALSGLREDMLVTHVAGQPVSTPREFRNAVAGKEGREVELQFWSTAGSSMRPVVIPAD